MLRARWGKPNRLMQKNDVIRAQAVLLWAPEMKQMSEIELQIELILANPGGKL